MCDLLTSSFTRLSQKLSSSKTCVVTIKHHQISLMGHRHTTGLAQNIFSSQMQTCTITATCSDFKQGLSLSLRLRLHYLTPSYSLLLEGVEPNLTIDSQSPISAECPLLLSSDLCTLTLTPEQLSTSSHTEKRDIFTAHLTLIKKNSGF